MLVAVGDEVQLALPDTRQGAVGAAQQERPHVGPGEATVVCGNIFHYVPFSTSDRPYSVISLMTYGKWMNCDEYVPVVGGVGGGHFALKSREDLERLRAGVAPVTPIRFVPGSLESKIRNMTLGTLVRDYNSKDASHATKEKYRQISNLGKISALQIL